MVGGSVLVGVLGVVQVIIDAKGDEWGMKGVGKEGKEAAAGEEGDEALEVRPTSS